MSIKDLVGKYDAERDFYLTNEYNETLLRSDFLDPLFELLGWDIKNAEGKSTNEREVILEESLKASASEHSKKPDYTFRLFSERKFFLEAKKPSVKIESVDGPAKQVRRYGFTAKLKISVLSNFEHLIIYDTSIKVESTDSFQKAIVKSYHYTEYEENFDEIRELLGRDSVYSGDFDIQWKEIEDKIDQYSVDDLFLNQINEWRVALGREVYKSDSSLDEDRLNDIVQSYLNRILFLRVCEDRNIEEYKTLLQYADETDFNALIRKFKAADKRYNSGLFDQLLTDEIVEDISSVFWDIIHQLYYPESPYSFSVFSSDVLGHIYEIFLSEKLSVIDDEVQLIKKPENVDRDIVTTPTFIIRDILRNTISLKCEGKTDKEILKLKFADISCGSGAFLLELFQLLNDTLIDYYLENDSAVLIQTNIETFKLPFDIKVDLLLNCIYGVDKDYNAVGATKFGLLLKLLEEEDTETTKNSKPILPELTHNIFFGNSLLSPAIVKEVHQTEVNPFDFSDLKFDVIVGNPPYMKSGDMKNFTPSELPLYKESYTSAYKQFDKYFIFIERGLNLLTDSGILGYIVPSKFTKVGAGKKLRALLSENEHLHSIVSFGANQVFKGRTTYTCLLVLNKQAEEKFKYTEIKDLNKWKVREQREVEYAYKETKSLNSEVWPLVPKKLTKIYQDIINKSIGLEELVGKENIFNGIQTSANRTYIFSPTKEDDQYFFFEKNDRKIKIEKDFTKPYFQTSRGSDNLYTYRTFKPNARVIYPYFKTESGVDFLDLSTIEADYPFAYKYLQQNKDILANPNRDIKPKPETEDEWYRYGRHQSLDSCGLPQKIIVGVLSTGDKYAVDTFGTLISSGGTAGYCVVALPEDSEYSIYYLQAILNSKYLEWFCSLYGEVFRGGYIARGTKVLKRLPIPKIDFDNKDEKEAHDNIAEKQRQLIESFDAIDQNKGNNRRLIPLKAKFRREKGELERMLKELFDLGEADLLIPLIQEEYEAD